MNSAEASNLTYSDFTYHQPGLQGPAVGAWQPAARTLSLAQVWFRGLSIGASEKSAVLIASWYTV